MLVPENEAGVIVRFTQECRAKGIEIVKIGTKFPDATLAVNGHKYKAEFEFVASNFCMHRHDPRHCDIIICWENDLDDYVLPIIALKENWSMIKGDDLPSQLEKEVEYWKARALRAEERIIGLEVETDTGASRRRRSYNDYVHAVINGELSPDLSGSAISEWAGRAASTGRRWKAMWREESAE